MPGGIGPVSESARTACTCSDREIASLDNANEIFFHLDSRRVYYDPHGGHLYFVASPDNLVERIVRGVCESLPFSQMYLDPNRCFSGARRVALNRQQARTVMVALRLAGVRTSVRQ